MNKNWGDGAGAAVKDNAAIVPEVNHTNAIIKFDNFKTTVNMEHTKVVPQQKMLERKVLENEWEPKIVKE